MAMRLILKSTGRPLANGDYVTTFRGERGKLAGWREPRHGGSTGRVYVTIDGNTHEWFPSVIGAVIRETVT